MKGKYLEKRSCVVSPGEAGSLARHGCNEEEQEGGTGAADQLLPEPWSRPRLGIVLWDGLGVWLGAGAGRVLHCAAQQPGHQ